jgi:hypothetical protein
MFDQSRATPTLKSKSEREDLAKPDRYDHVPAIGVACLDLSDRCRREIRYVSVVDADVAAGGAPWVRCRGYVLGRENLGFAEAPR